MKEFRAMPLVPTWDMVNAAYVLLENLPIDTPERQKRAVHKIWQAMAEAAPPPRQGSLTAIQRQCLEIIADHINETGKSPTYTEIGRQMNRPKHAVHYIVKALKRRGFIAYREAHSRSIRILIQPGTKP